MLRLMPVLIDDRDGCRILTLDRAPLNVFDHDLVAELLAALRALDGRRDIKVVVIRSAIAGTFSAGVDVADHARNRAAAMLESFGAVIRRLDTVAQATVAAVDGRALGGGCELAACCDIVLATPRSTFAVPEIDVGCFPPVAVTLFPRLIGRAAFEMVLTGAPLSATEAMRVGLINRVVDDLDAETAAMAARLSSKSGVVLAIARRALRQGRPGRFSEALAAAERRYRDELLPTEDAQEGVRAFVEKRKPVWRDR
jgi:cyclohexa-1,5-dienecarbonyl-CoA hydratase